MCFIFLKKIYKIIVDCIVNLLKLVYWNVVSGFDNAADLLLVLERLRIPT